jgi:hypothetical protein
MKMAISCTALLMLVVIALACSAAADVVVYVPFESAMCRYQFYTCRFESAPDSVHATNYDDSTWPTGMAPFGASDSLCDVGMVSTPWTTPETSIVLRIWVPIPEGADYLWVRPRFRNEFSLWCNGWSWMSCYGPTMCPWKETSVHSSGNWGGLNLFVFVADAYRDGRFLGARYFDFQIEANDPAAGIPEPSEHGQTWGRIKSMYW